MTKRKSLILTLCMALVMCLCLGFSFSSGTMTVHASSGTAPTIIRTGGNDVDRKNHMGNLPAAIKGKPYKAEDGSNYKIEATGTEPFTFHAYKSGEGRAPLPEGLSLNSVTGEIEGTPTGESGPYNISVTVTNKYGSDNIFVGMYVYDETSKPQITTPAGALPDGYLNSSYNQKIDFTHNMSNFPEVSIPSGTLPDGLTFLRQGRTIAIYGTPTKARTYTFTVRVENGAGFDEKQYTITIKNEIVRPEIQMDMTVINDGYSKVNDSGNLEIIKGKPVDVQFCATGTNTPEKPIKWSCDTSVLPAGLNLSESGRLTGTVAESVDLGYSGNKYFYIKLKATNINGSGAEQSNTSYAALIVYENGKITGVTISPENTSVPKGGQRQFTATVIGYGDFDKSVTWNVYYHSSKDTKISQDGILTVGVDETATEIGVEARIDRDTFKEIPVTIIDHTHSITLVPKTPETCTTDGNKEHYKCNVCGDLFADAKGVNVLTEEQVKIPAGHEYGDLVSKQEPTCTQTGMQAYYKCSVCNKYFDESKTEKTVAELTISIDPNAHDFGAWTDEVPATCVATGTKGHKDCNRCNKHYDKSGNEITDLTISINPNAHDFGAWIEEVPATCVATGTKGHKDCSRCNKHYDESGNEITDLTIPTNDNHDWNAWASNLDGTHTRTCKRDSGHKENGTCTGGTATCTTKAVCDVCGTTYGDTAPHTYGELIPEVPATADKTGTKKHYKCSVCGKLFDENKNEVTAADLIIPKIGTHKVTVNGGTGGGEYEEGASVTLTANTPGVGERFTGWTLTGVSVADTTQTEITFNMPANAVTATANYEIITYNVNVEKGTATPNKQAQGVKVTITANEPEIGYKFDRWTTDSTDVSFLNATSQETTFTMPNHDVTVTATYVKATYNISVTDCVAKKGEDTVGYAYYGDVIKVTANTAPTGKVFDTWVITGLDTTDMNLTNPEITFNMPANVVEIRATYGEARYNVNVTGGTANKEKAKYGETVTITATIPTGKKFVEWTSSTVLVYADKTNVTTTFTMPAGDVTVEAKFEDELYRVDVTNGTTTLDMATYQTEVTVKANEPDTDMYFDKWEVTGLDTTDMDLTKTEIKFNMPAGNVTFEAKYLSVPKYDIIMVDGTKDISPAKAGETITITANGAPTGKVFDKWTCETADVTIEFASATSSTTTFVMPAREITIQAHFRDVGTTPSVEIKVKGGTGAGVVKQGDTVAIIANAPAEGKRFKHWENASGEILSTKATYEFSVRENITLTAVYEDIETNPTPDKAKQGLSGGQIAGIVIGSVLLAGIGGFAIFWFAVKKKTFADIGIAFKKFFEKIKNLFKKKK